MTTKINYNGEISDHVLISALDHGFLFGDSVYEVLGTRNNAPCFVAEHLDRLRKSASEISLKICWSDERFIQEIKRTLEVAGNKESYIRLVVTRGEGKIDIDPASCERPNFLIYVTPSADYPRTYYENGINVALVSIKRNPRDALNPGIKTGNYLNNVLAKIEANKAGANDALMLNTRGHLTECTTSNFFFVQEGRVRTPSIDCGILSGITRDIILRLTRENHIPMEEGQWDPRELEKAGEAFLTGTLKRVMPVTRLDGKPIGNGKPGPVTQKLMRLYEAFLEKRIN